MVKLLAVDDDEAVLRSYRNGFGHSVAVFTTTTGSDAATIARAQRPELIVTDLRLRNEWGILLIRQLRALLPTSRIALVSGFVSAGSAVSAIRAGADLVIPKPARPREILRELEATLGDGDGGDGEPPEPFPTLASIEWEHILRALEESGGNVSGAARLLGLRRTSLQRKLKLRRRSQS
ncbi:MAG TPA: response regulator [Acidimicrobiia bacterium]|jgi:two-component system response regulator RegA|nr:response regulator [Acidimicrobiia bacterium]